MLSLILFLYLKMPPYLGDDPPGVLKRACASCDASIVREHPGSTRLMGNPGRHGPRAWRHSHQFSSHQLKTLPDAPGC